MGKKLHILYVVFLLSAGVLSAVVPGAFGSSYYTSSLEDRPFHPQYEILKPTGFYGHGYGIVGSFMIIFGVILYSSRKRMRSLANTGKIKYFLEFHIFLCLLGPILVLYHTTFKFGGLVAVSFWSMAAVVLSGVVGRYLYVQLPKGIHGNELSVNELSAENAKLFDLLQKEFGLNAEYIKRIDEIAVPRKLATHMGLMETLNFFIVNDLTRRSKLRSLYRVLEERGLQKRVIKHLRTTANRRIILSRRIAFLSQFRTIFHYWHVVHLPFSIVMFVILFVHVGVAIAFGYRWIW